MPYAIYSQQLRRNREYSRTPEGKAAHAKANKAWRERNRRKVAAWSAVARAIERGDLTRHPCERCGNEQAEAHHDDYDKPLVVMWLCDDDHKARHRELKAAGINP